MMIEINKISDLMQYIDDIEAVIFDMDDTLYNEKDYVKSGYKAVAEQMLYEYPYASSMLWEEFISGNPVIDMVLDKLGIYSEELKHKCLQVYREHIPSIKLSNEVERVLIEIRKQNKKLGIITDGRPNGQRLKIQALKLDEYIDNIIITDELGGVSYRKPCDKSFVKMKMYFDVEYGEMCYVGDNINKDFISPDKLGMKSIWLKNKEGLYYSK